MVTSPVFVVSCYLDFFPRADEAAYLVNGSNFLEGKVLFYSNGQRGSVCGRSWEMDDADVVCRSLGFGHAYSISTYTASDGVIEDIAIGPLHCIGNESNVFDCPGAENRSNDNCNGSGNARVVCSGGRYFQS